MPVLPFFGLAAIAAFLGKILKEQETKTGHAHGAEAFAADKQIFRRKQGREQAGVDRGITGRCCG